MKGDELTFGSIFILLLLCSGIVGEDRRRIRRETDGSVYCDFDETRNNHTASDLLQCIDELAVDLVVDRESASATNGNGQRNGSTGRRISFIDVFSNIFNMPATSHQSGSLPAHSTSGYQQSNYPSGTTALSAGFQLNFLAEALSTISRHDDYKCVARILCEMASGKLPGRSLGKRGSGFLEFLGRTVFTDWLAKIDVGGSSPLLNFGTAMILGYSNRGSSEPCYQAFPKCPRDMNGLVHYLNNYNGGFFRLFNRIRGGKYRESNEIVGQRVEDYSKIDVKGRIVGGNSRKYIPIQSAEPPEIRNTVQFPAMSYQEYLKKKGIPGYDDMSSEVIFPNERDLSNVEPSNSVENDGTKSELNIWKDKIAFFPEGNRDRGLSRFRFPSDFPLASS
ncbi:uncharacterized protein LOC108000104 isoform X2 [Apis cerana]|uniref:uncharacterized protein LOC108000104 isoform X2 n=1 Tax=Apis cerana TaxID=7461 RepID=UPI002B231F87|nr:uncharacterized protein LOC108000104 isoform X2 [Apis cerana]